jgi:hypothetical protein
MHCPEFQTTLLKRLSKLHRKHLQVSSTGMCSSFETQVRKKPENRPLVRIPDHEGETLGSLDMVWCWREMDLGSLGSRYVVLTIESSIDALTPEKQGRIIRPHPKNRLHLADNLSAELPCTA